MMDNKQQSPNMLRVKEAARLLRVSESWLRLKARAGEVPHFRPHAHALLFDKRCLLMWFERFAHGGDQTPGLRPKALKAVQNGPLRSSVAFGGSSRVQE